MIKKIFSLSIVIVTLLCHESKAFPRKWKKENNDKKVVSMFIENSYLKDPSSVQLKGVMVSGTTENGKEGKPSIWCGYFNAKNSYGAYVGFKPFLAMKSEKKKAYMVFSKSGGTGADEVEKQLGNNVCDGSGVFF